MRALYCMAESIAFHALSIETRKEIALLLDEEPKQVTGEDLERDPSLIEGIDILIVSYGACRLTENILKHADKLKVVLSAVGSVRGIVSDAFWERGLQITSAASANAIPVAEFSFASILLLLKRFFFHERNYRENGDYNQYEMPGAYNSKVGIISYGLIAKLLCKYLKQTGINVHVWSPELNEQSAAKDGLIYTPLDEIFKICDVVSLHTPLLPETIGMLKKEHFLSMKPNGSFLNTSRGQIIDEKGMIEALKERPDITAMLDVTAYEPINKGDELFNMPNVIVTPHIAGAYNNERNRLGELVLEELKRFLNNQPFKYGVTQAQLKFMA